MIDRYMNERIDAVQNDTYRRGPRILVARVIGVQYDGSNIDEIRDALAPFAEPDPDVAPYGSAWLPRYAVSDAADGICIESRDGNSRVLPAGSWVVFSPDVQHPEPNAEPGFYTDDDMRTFFAVLD